MSNLQQRLVLPLLILPGLFASAEQKNAPQNTYVLGKKQLSEAMIKLAKGVDPTWTGPTEVPFWKKKKKVYRRMVSERKIPVSAPITETNSGTYLWKLQGAGITSAPPNYSFELVSQFERLADTSSFFKEVWYWPEHQILFIHGQVLTFHARMWMKLKLIPDPKSKNHQVHFKVFNGSFYGMQGVFAFEDYERRKTEISMTAAYVSKTIPLPKVLMNLGIEIFIHRAASGVRSYVEEQYKLSPMVQPKLKKVD